MKLKDKVAIVAGGGQGIGRGIALCLAEEGADVVVMDINGEAARQTTRQVESKGRRALALAADLTNEEQVNRSVADSLDFFGRLDILVNNVGGVSQQMYERLAASLVSPATVLEFPQFMGFTTDLWDRYYELNLKSHVLLCRAVIPHFVRQRSGKIVNISSVAGRNAEPGHVPYGAMKAADISLTWSLARDLARYNINVNCVCPGLVYTPLWERGANFQLQAIRELVRSFKQRGEELPSQLAPFADVDLDKMSPRDYWLKYIVLPSTPLQREQTPEDIGKAVVFLASEDARNITGQILHVDGGLVMR